MLSHFRGIMSLRAPLWSGRYPQNQILCPKKCVYMQEDGGWGWCNTVLSERKVSWGSRLVFQISVLFHMQMFTNSRIPEVFFYLFISFSSWVYCNQNHQKLFWDRSCFFTLQLQLCSKRREKVPGAQKACACVSDSSTLQCGFRQDERFLRICLFCIAVSHRERYQKRPPRVLLRMCT